MLSILLLIQNATFIAETAALVISGPTYVTLWTAWRVLTCCFPRLYHKGDRAFYSCYQRMVVFFFEHCSRTRLKFYGDYDALTAKKENVLFISNHQCTVDWILADFLALRQGRLGSLQYILKNSLRYIPLFGFYFYQHGFVFVRRGVLDEDIRKQLRYYKTANIPVWLVIFPEGTRFNPDKKEALDKCKEYAVSHGLPPLQHVLTPMLKGTQMALEELRTHFDAVYDVTIAYSGTRDENGNRGQPPSMVDFLKGHSPNVHVDIRRIPIGDIPTEKDELYKWMYDMFVRKDAVLSSFFSPKPALQHGAEIPLPIWSTLGPTVGCMLLNYSWLHLPGGAWLYLKVSLISSFAGICWMRLKRVRVERSKPK